MRHQSRLILAVALVALLSLPMAVWPASAGALSCGPCPAATTDALNLRAEPSLSAEILLVMPAGAELEWDPTQDEIDGYVAVSYEGVDGWAHRDYLLLFPVFATTTANLNLRADPSLGAEVLLVMPEGAQTMVLWGPRNSYFQSATTTGSPAGRTATTATSASKAEATMASSRPGRWSRLTPTG